MTDFDRFTQGDGGGDMDAGPDGDGGDCSDPVDELCNERDDDCDGNVDEDFNFQTDVENCGSCANVCGDVEMGDPDCSGGECVPACEPGWGDCDGAYATGCEVELTDPDNCGMCGEVCAVGTVCSVSMGCVTDCPGTETICGRSCVDTDTSILHCGGCDMPCASPANSVGVCAAGTCDFVCDAGFDDCDGDPANGCETDLSQITDCGTCDNVCNYPSGVAACDGTSCSLMGCLPGFDNCDGIIENGCEADLSSVMSCGTCGMACTAPANASATCDGTTCGFTCDMGFEDCDGMAANGCEADLSSDMTCGTCMNSCSGATPLCSGGTCVSGCMAPTPDRCGMTCTDVNTDPSNCSACGMACPNPMNASPTCAGGSCDFVCDPGFEDCDGMAANGCETNIRTVANCGGCGTVCAPANGTGACGTGTCTIASCNTGFDNCDGLPGNGCETNTGTVLNCGTCGNTCTVANGMPGCSGGTCFIAGCAAGFDDCNTMYADGCEEALTTYYSDGDGDTFGRTSASMDFCLGSAPAGWTMFRDDCDDTDPSEYPGAPPLCDDPAADTDCDGDVDEGFGVGTACECEPGADRGSITCDPPTGMSMSSSCAYPAEVCNGLDDDCDGTPDNRTGFTCVAGSTQTCMTSCGTTGTQVCSNTTCTWSPCTPPAEACNLTDDDCDGDVDEGLIGRIASQTWTVTNQNQPLDMAVNAVRGEVAVAYIADSTNRFYVARFTPDLGSIIAVDNLGGTGAKRAPRIEATTSGEYWVSYFDPGAGRITYGWYTGTGSVSWSNFGSSMSNVYDVTHDAGGRIWVFYREGGGVTLSSATPGGGLAGFSPAANPYPGALDHVSIANVRGGIHVVYGSSSFNRVEWRRLNTLGNTVGGPVELLPAGNTYDSANPWRSLFIDGIPGTSTATDRLGVFFHQRNAGGTNQYRFAYISGDGTVIWNTTRNRGTLDGFMELSEAEDLMVMSQFDDILRHSLAAGAQESGVNTSSEGNDAALTADILGPMRYFHVGADPGRTTLEIYGVGCL